jgi:hypothetical protein
MALTVDLSVASEVVNGDAFTITLDDDTVYGGANPARVDVAVFISGEKIKQDGTADYDVTIDYAGSTDETDATSFTFDIEDDGRYKIKYAIIPDYDNADAYVAYDVVYSSGIVYQAIQSTTGNAPPNATYWSIVSEPTALLDDVGTASESGNLAYQEFNQILYPFSKVAFGNAAEDAALECCSDCERGEDVKLYELLGVYIDGMSICNQREKWQKGERIARASQSLIEANDL